MSLQQLNIRSIPQNNLNSTIRTIRDTQSYMTTSYTAKISYMTTSYIAKTAPSLLIAASTHFRFASVFLNPDRVVMTLTKASTPQEDVCFVSSCISPHTRLSSLSTDDSFVLFVSYLLNIHTNTLQKCIPQKHALHYQSPSTSFLHILPSPRSYPGPMKMP